jgi:hypothetical protein
MAMREVAGATVEKWLDIELPKLQNPRVDMLGEAAGGGLIHVELQSTNDPSMPLRMAEYSLGVFRLFGRFPRQILLYVGQAPLRMGRELSGPDVSFRYGLVDMRDLDGDRLPESEEAGDNVIAILARLRDHREAVRKIVAPIAGLASAKRATALEQLLILAGLRRLEEVVEQKVRHMPLYDSILDNKVLGREYKRGELALLRRLIEKRFGTLPNWAEERLTGRSVPEIEEVGLRLLEVASLEDLLQ